MPGLQPQHDDTPVRTHPWTPEVERTLNALYWARTPGFHFAGYFLRVSCEQLDPDACLLSMDVGPHCCGHQGTLDAVSLGVFSDVAMATAVRAAMPTACRLATVSIQLQVTGRDVGHRLQARARFRGGHATAHQQVMSEVDIMSGDVLVAMGQATFMALPMPEGRMASALRTWNDALAEPRLPPSALTPQEQAIFRAALRASATDGPGFAQAFWGVQTRRLASGSRSRLDVSPQVTNRVGHVQGGILLGQAIDTALASAPPGWAVSAISANYLAPGTGNAMLARARPLHTGRSTAASRVQIRGGDRTPVVEAQATLVSPSR